MIRTSVFSLFCAALLLGMSSNVRATPFPIPDSTVFSADIDASGYFNVGAGILSFEFFDLAELDLANAQTVFGFYFRNDPGNLVPIFDPFDNTTASGGPLTQQTVVNFLSGAVLDLDAGGTVEATFSGSGAIGFYLLMSDSLQNTFGLPAVIFSDPLLNAGFDLFGAFPSLVDPATMGTVFYALDASGPITLSYTITGTLTPVSAPLTLWLMFSGVFAVLARCSLSSAQRRQRIQ